MVACKESHTKANEYYLQQSMRLHSLSFSNHNDITCKSSHIQIFTKFHKLGTWLSKLAACTANLKCRNFCSLCLLLLLIWWYSCLLLYNIQAVLVTNYSCWLRILSVSVSAYSERNINLQLIDVYSALLSCQNQAELVQPMAYFSIFSLGDCISCFLRRFLCWSKGSTGEPSRVAPNAFELESRSIYDQLELYWIRSRCAWSCGLSLQCFFHF